MKTRSLSADGRAWIAEVWEAAENFSAQLSDLSPATSAVGLRFADSHAVAEGVAGEEVRQTFFTVIKVGYAARAVLAVPTDQPPLDLSLLPSSARAKLEQDRIVVAELVDALASVALDDLGSVMTLPAEVWAGYIALAVRELQRRLGSSTVTAQQLTADRIETMVCYGYVLRCLDEALEREPTAKSAIKRANGV